MVRFCLVAIGLTACWVSAGCTGQVADKGIQHRHWERSRIGQRDSGRRR